MRGFTLNIGNKFELGALTATANVHERMMSDSEFKAFCEESLLRHQQCDWGDLCDEDKLINDDALKNGGRLMSSYTFQDNGTRLWIITESDRSATTLLFPHEY